MIGDLTELGQVPAAMDRDLVNRMVEVILLTMFEFDRTVRENGDGGTDQVNARAMLVLGGAVDEGHVYGRWPEL